MGRSSRVQNSLGRSWATPRGVGRKNHGGVNSARGEANHGQVNQINHGKLFSKLLVLASWYTQLTHQTTVKLLLQLGIHTTSTICTLNWTWLHILVEQQNVVFSQKNLQKLSNGVLFTCLQCLIVIYPPHPPIKLIKSNVGLKFLIKDFYYRYIF